MIGNIITDVAEMFRTARRMGTSVDEPEGSSCITISDTLAKQLTEKLESYNAQCNQCDDCSDRLDLFMYEKNGYSFCPHCGRQLSE